MERVERIQQGKGKQVEDRETMEQMKESLKRMFSQKLAFVKRWALIALPVLLLVGALIVGVPALRAKPAHEKLVGFMGFAEEGVTQQPSVVLIERVGTERIVTVLPGGVATKARSACYFSSRTVGSSEIEDVNDDGYMDLVIDGVILYNQGGDFTLQPPTPTPETAPAQSHAPVEESGKATTPRI